MDREVKELKSDSSCWHELLKNGSGLLFQLVAAAVGEAAILKKHTCGTWTVSTVREAPTMFRFRAVLTVMS